MTWLEKLYENPSDLAEYHREFADSYWPRAKLFGYCIDEFEIFKSLGLKFRIPDCTGDCMKCELDFLTDPEVYEFTTKGE